LVLLRPELLSGPEPSRLVDTGRPAVDSYADAVARTAPSVVSIITTKLTREAANPQIDNPILRRFFGLDRAEPKIKRENSLGSGVIVEKNGYVLTNNHVIEGARERAVLLSDGRQMPARVVGIDPDTDLALLQAGGPDLPAATLGESSTLQVGDVVLAIGNPFAVGQTVTMGIVSATGRSRLGITNFENFIQTDAAINPGNSGGALINSRGEVVGINTAIFSRSGGSHGIGFAIPVQLARGVMQQLIDHGRVVRGWLGITAQELTPEVAESLGMTDPRGLLIAGVIEDGPAAKAGIGPGDVILSVEGTQIDSAPQLLDEIAARQPGDNIRITLLRDRREVALHAQLEERPTR
jgi:Do/DeqQ family serine protease